MGLEAPLPTVGPGEKIAPGSVILGFDAILPVSEETCTVQISANMAAGYIDAVRRRAVTIIANGPSALSADLRAIKGPTLAVNGALKLFLEQGLEPTYWAACDPQALVADFLPANPPATTIYLIASKCHPSVIEKLRYRNVRIWHLSDHPADGHLRVPTACSVTISAAWLLHKMGFTDFEFWGWDGCLMDGLHHASSDEKVGIELEINWGGTVENEQFVGGKTFATTRAWAAEANSATQFFQLAEYFDLGVKVHGDGMFKAAREFTLERN